MPVSRCQTRRPLSSPLVPSFCVVPSVADGYGIPTTPLIRFYGENVSRASRCSTVATTMPLRPQGPSRAMEIPPPLRLPLHRRRYRHARAGRWRSDEETTVRVATVHMTPTPHRRRCFLAHARRPSDAHSLGNGSSTPPGGLVTAATVAPSMGWLLHARIRHSSPGPSFHSVAVKSGGRLRSSRDPQVARYGLGT